MATADHAVSGVAERYARALFDLAEENSSVTQTGAALSSFLSMHDASPELQRLVRSPLINKDDAAAAVEAIASKVKIEGLALNFLKLMGANGRLAAVPAAIAAFHALVAQNKGQVIADVTSAERLSAKQLADLKAALKSAVGSEVVIKAKIDKSILGGMIVKVGSRMLDNSLKTKLENLKVAMKGSQ